MKITQMPKIMLQNIMNGMDIQDILLIEKK